VRGQPLIDAAASRLRHLAVRRSDIGPPSAPRSRSAAQYGVSDADSHGLPGALAVAPSTGFVWDRGELLCAIQVRPDTAAITTISTRRSLRTAEAVLTPALLAPLLDQFDIRLSGIDLHVRGVRTAGPGPGSLASRRLIGPLPAAARRDAVIVIRLDPALCPDAVARRAARGADR